MDLEPTEVKAWRHHPATHELVRRLRETIEERKSMWASGLFTQAEVEASAMLNAKELAYVQALEAVIDSIDSFVEEVEEEG